MKKLISITLASFFVCFLFSCRQDDSDLITNRTDDASTKLIQKINDSIRKDSVNIANNLLLSDPPPRNGHQW